MAHTILVRLDVDDEYADIHPDITATDYLEGSKAHGWEVVTERVFTESEVRAILNTFMDHLRDGCSVMSGDVRAVARYHGIVLDPA